MSLKDLNKGERYMAIWAISDFHLSFGVDKPMNIFGENWDGYEEKLKKNWIENIHEDDTVLMAGDFSWGMYLDETIDDFKFLERLPGKKILIKGNHDYWWETLNKLEVFKSQNGFNSISFLHNNFYAIGAYAICGTRGWEFGAGEVTGEQDKKVYEREKERLIRSLALAKSEGYNDIIAMVHYNVGINDEYVEILKNFGVKMCVFGHLHGKAEILRYKKDGIEFVCTSCDLINFMPVRVF